MENEIQLCDIEKSQYQTGSELDRLACECGYASGYAACTDHFQWQGTYSEAIADLKQQLEDLEDGE